MRAYRIGLLGALLAILAACGASEKMAPASVEQPKAPDFANVPIVDDGPLVGMHFTQYGVNPTVDTREAAESAFGLSADQASLGLVQLQLNQGNLPDRASVRVEDFINGPTPPPPASNAQGLFAVDTELFPSPSRPGYEVLRVSLTARVNPAPRRVFVVLDAAAARTPEVRTLLSRLTSALDPADQIAVMGAGRAVILPLVSAKDARVQPAIANLLVGHDTLWSGVKAAQRMAQGDGQLIYITDGLANHDQHGYEWFLGAVPRGQHIAWTVVGLGRGPYSDGRLVQLAAATGGRYMYTNPSLPVTAAQLAPRPVVAINARATLRFNPGAVARYRLLGHERFARTSSGVIGARIVGGSTVTVLWEVQRASGDNPLGTLDIRANDTKKAPIHQAVLLSPTARSTFAAASPFSRQALIAAALAEKLRSAWWVRGVSYAVLRAQLDAIPASQRDATLDRMLTQAQKLDTRGDAYAHQGPIAQMKFDHVPIVRR